MRLGPFPVHEANRTRSKNADSMKAWGFQSASGGTSPYPFLASARDKFFGFHRGLVARAGDRNAQVIVHRQSSARRAEDAIARNSEHLQTAFQGRGQNSKTIFHASPEVNRRCFREVFRGTGKLADAVIEANALGEHLIVENKIVRVFQNRQIDEHVSREGPESRMVLGQLGASEGVLKCGEKAIGHVLV